jgi:hypothetical protein
LVGEKDQINSLAIRLRNRQNQRWWARRLLPAGDES